MSLPERWPHQKREREQNAHKPKLALFWSPRTGKTLAAADDLLVSGARRAIITAPLAVCKDWCDILVELGFPTVVPAYKGKVADLEGLRRLREAGAVVVINDDKLSLGIEELIRFKPEACIFDEAHRLKAVTGKRSRAARRLGHIAEHVRLLTGTPAPNHYGDLWAPMSITSRDDWGYTFGSYRDKYLIVDSMFPSRVLGHKNTQELQALILKYASIVRREDVFGPDDYQYVTRMVDLPSRARKAYDEFAREWVLHGPEITATNVLTRILHLRQIAGGFIADRDRGEMLHDAIIDRLLADLDEIAQSGQKAIIGHFFRWEGAQIASRIKQLLGVPVEEYNGDVDGDERKQIERRFNEYDGPRFVVAQYQTAGLGVSFATADHLMFVSSTFSFADMEQMRDRVYAPDPALGKGKRRVITSYRATDTIHEFIGDVIDRKGNVHEALRNADREAIAYGRFKRR